MMEQEITSAMTWILFDDLSDGIVITDPDGTVLYSNQAAASLLGLNHQVDSLDEVAQVLASFSQWSELLRPPASFQWTHPKSGRVLSFHSLVDPTSENVTFVRILIQPVENTVPSPFEQISVLTQISRETDFKKQLQLLAEGLQVTGWERVVITLRDETFSPIQLISAGFEKKEKEELPTQLLSPEAWLELFDDEDLQQYFLDGTYFVPSESRWSQKYLRGQVKVEANDVAWQPKDLVCVPLYDRQQKRIGLVGLDRPLNGRRPDTQTLQTIRFYAQFAASIIENAQLVQEAVDRSREFELLLTASNNFSSSLETDTLLSLLGQHIRQAIDIWGYTIYQWGSGEEKLVVLKDFVAEKGDIYAEDTAVSISDVDALKPALLDKKPITFQIQSEKDALLPSAPWLHGRESYTSLILPIVLADETFAIIHLVPQAPRPINDQELRLLTALVNQASIALETALIFEDTYERERFYGAMGNVSMALNYTLDRHSVLRLICSESLRIFSVDGAYIWQFEKDAFTSSAAKGHGENDFVNMTVPLTDASTFVAHIARLGVATYINDIHNSDMHIRLPQPEKICSVLGVPLEAEGQMIGVLILVDTKDTARFSDKDITQTTMFGVQVAIALQNAKLFEELRQLNEELDLRVARRTRALHEESNRVKILLRITTELSASLDQDRVLTKALDLVNEVVNATNGVILLLNQETNEFDFRASLTQERPLSHRGVPSGLKRDEGLAGWMLENRSAVIVHDTKTDPRWIELPASSAYRSVLGVPLISNEEVIGVLMLFHTEMNAFTNQQLDLVEAAAIQVANAINNASLYNLIFDQAEQLGSILRGEIIQKANLQAILESIADGVIVANNSNEIEITNVSASNILDIPREQLIGKSINELLGVYGKFGDAWMETIGYWADNSDRLEPGTYLDDQLIIEDRYVSIHLSPVLSEDNFFGTVSIFRDITKEVEVDRLKSEFVSTVSHELRTPMTSIKGYADLMLMGAAGQLTDPQKRYLQVIKSNADRLHDLVNDLLNISRIETGKTTLDLRPLDIPQVIDQIIGHLKGRIQHENKPITVQADIEPGLPLVNADHARVTQILTNLVDNAFNYTPNDGSILIGVRATPRHVFISVSDTGIGISSENQEKIFDRFFRAEDSAVQKVSGTGLGLAIVRSLIEMHGGHLEVESTLGKGSTFTFNLPIIIEDSDPT